jgi:flavin-dependent dehydrogenase
VSRKEKEREMLDQLYDALVVGARIAGATVAALLGDAGYRVLLVDRASFPSATLSTHFFRGAGLLAVLARLQLLDPILALDAPPLVHCYYYSPETAVPVVGPPQEPGTLGYDLSVRREVLDALLVQRAKLAPTVEVAERTWIAALLWERARVVGARLITPEGPREIRARIVIGADGRHSSVARAVTASSEKAEPASRALYYRYMRGFVGPDGRKADGAEFSQHGDELAYIFPSDAEVTCVALSLNLADFAWLRLAPQERFHDRLARHAGLAERVRAAEACGPVLGSGPLPNYGRVPAGSGWALVGDAGLHQDPWSGLGMDMASVHATFLAEALLAWFGQNTSESEALTNYHRRRNEHALAGYHRTVTLARDLRQLKRE